MCGVIGVYGPERVADDVFFCLKALKNRGRSGAGIMTYDNYNIFQKKIAGPVEELINLNELKNYSGRVGIGHVRYSTTGSSNIEELKKNAQPEYKLTPFLIASVHNGNIYNHKAIVKKPDFNKVQPRNECDIQAILLPIWKELGNLGEINEGTIVQASSNVMEEVRGSYSAVNMASDGGKKYLFSITDPYKIRPLVVGKRESGEKNFWYIVSETSALKRVGAEYFMDVPGGSVLYVYPEENDPHCRRIVRKEPYHCMFEWVYFAKQNSEIEKISVNKVRHKIGETLAKEHPADADVVVPVPKTGWPYGIGFSKESGIPLDEGMIKYEDTRTFILQLQEDRNKEAKHNIEILDSVVRDKRVVLVDDSLIRGTNITNYIKKFRKSGAKEVHVRIGCPPVMSPCYLGIDMTKKNEFVIRGDDGLRDWQEVEEKIGAESLGYLSMNGLKSAIRGNKDFGLCTGCIEEIPEGYPPDMRKDVENLFSLDDGIGRVYDKF